MCEILHIADAIEKLKILPISVCMTVYNGEPFLKECIDSILSQSFHDFELLIVDDGSTDSTVNIILSYQDKRIRLLKNKHDYISSLNLLLKEARGLYIARMDADDIMLPERLQIQYDFLETHPEIGILGGASFFFNKEKEFLGESLSGEITVENLINGNYLSHPTVMMRKKMLKDHGLSYRQDFIYAEDYDLWCQAALAGIRIYNLKEPLIKYRMSANQVSTLHSAKQAEAASSVQRSMLCKLNCEEIKYSIKDDTKIKTTDNLLTVVIPFLNEKEEVENTVREIRRTVGDRVDIIVINDCSYDRYPYGEKLLCYNVNYLFNTQRKGVAASRDYGVQICKTPYFLLLDAHMRFEGGEWSESIVKELKNNDRQLLCCQTKPLYKDKETGCLIASKESSKTYGAYSPFQVGSDWPDIKWNFKEFYPHERKEEIAIVLGAGYAASKRYWTYLRGLEGLQFYGSDEAYISYKVWMEGGECILLKDVVIGHIYRTSAPYKIQNKHSIYNQLLIARLLFPQSLFCQALAYSCGNNKRIVFNALELLSQKAEWVEDTRTYYKSIFTKDIQFLLQLHHKYRDENTVLVKEAIGWLPEIYRKVSEQMPDTYGLFEGKAGFVLWLYHYRRFIHKPDEKIKLLWKEIEENVPRNKLSWEFGGGVSGIGWGALYLWENGMMDEYPASLIEYIDNQLAQINPFADKDISLETGVSGILAYLCFRLKFKSLKWPDSLLAQWHKISLNIIDSSNDYTLLYYAFLYNDIYKNGYEEENLNPSIGIWMSTSLFIPKNAAYWDLSLYNGVLASSLSAMLIKEFTTK